MATDLTLSHIPTEIVQGTTSAWTYQNADYPSATYALKYYFRSNKTALITLTGVAGSSGWTITLDSTTSATMKPDAYAWQAFAESDTARYLLDSGILLVTQDFAQNPISSKDYRSPARQRYEQYLEMLSNEALVKTLGPDQIESLEKITRQLQWDVKRENDAEKLKRQGYPSRKIFTRFS